MARIIEGAWNRKNTEPRLIDTLNIPLGRPVELAVWAVKRNGIRGKIVPTGEPITYRNVRNEVVGEIITVKPSKVWQFKNTVYMTGEAIDSRLDAKALGLKPLTLKEEGVWDPEKEPELFEPDDPFGKHYLPILAYGPRKQFEMEQVIPFFNPEDFDGDPILQASEAYESQDYEAAFKIINEITYEDLRCLDAHAHLGNWEFNSFDTPHKRTQSMSRRHFEVGIRIGELSLGEKFHDVLPWGFIDNRPYLRCMHGYGLCLWRAGEAEAAREVFERILWMNPSDNQGVRFLLADIDAGRTWYDAQAEEDVGLGK